MSEPDRSAFKQAATTSIVAPAGQPRPGLVDRNTDLFHTEILRSRMQHALRSQWLDAIVSAIRSDILASRRHA